MKRIYSVLKNREKNNVENWTDPKSPMGQCQAYSICAMKVLNGEESEQSAGKKCK